MQHFAEQALPHTMQPDLLSEQVNAASTDLRDSRDKNIPGAGAKCCRIKLVMVHLPFLGVKDFLGFIETYWYLFVPLYRSDWCAQTLGPG